jgi:hypothetical protein
VLIAISIYLKDLFTLLDMEDSLRCLSWVEAASLASLIGVEINPFDVMIFRHRVRDASDFDKNFFSFDFDDWEMFLGSFGGWALGNEFTHWFAATHDFATAVFDHGDYVAAMSANKKFDHRVLLYFSLVNLSIRHRGKQRQNMLKKRGHRSDL